MLHSMTGFSRRDGTFASGSFVWECRSVNGKSLDIRLRLPPGYEDIEPEVRKRIQGTFGRGSFYLALGVEITAANRQLEINRELMDELIRVSGEVSASQPEIAPITMDGLLAIRGVVELRDRGPDEAEQAERRVAILEGLDEALNQLKEARAAEGGKIAKVLGEQVDEIEALTKAVEDDPSRSADAIREKLATRLAEIVANAENLDHDRLYQEAATLAMKSDLAEEVDRLNSHVAEARTLLKSSEPVGRKLDFLCQEFNRECNTICSKSNAAQVTRHGLEMKVVIDRFREQIQNIE